MTRPHIACVLAICASLHTRAPQEAVLWCEEVRIDISCTPMMHVVPHAQFIRRVGGVYSRGRHVGSRRRHVNDR